MTDKAWKAVERRICRIFGGERRGADYVDRAGKGKNDCIECAGWSIEIKHMLRPSFGLIEEDVRKAEQRKEHPDDIPIAIMKRKRTKDKDALVCIRLEVFENQILPKLRSK